MSEKVCFRATEDDLENIALIQQKKPSWSVAKVLRESVRQLKEKLERQK